MNNSLSTNNLRVWGSDIDPGALEQAYKTASLPILAGPVALMPDAHVGIGATIGTVIATKNAIIPAAVGVDIGCGMIAAKLDLTATVLEPLNLTGLVREFGRSIPAGLAVEHGEAREEAEAWLADNPPPLTPPVDMGRVARQLGTLGSGNHFVEVCLDEDAYVWVVLHSGSRGVGNKIAEKYIAQAKRANQADLPDRDLAWLEAGTRLFDDYISMMHWAQRYAWQNRILMMDAALRQLSYFLGLRGAPIAEVNRINCHHNFAQEEEHGGVRVWITRKGAIAAYEGQMGIIPGSMGTATYITSGKGNPDSYCSSSHGAGRRLSRGQAKRTLSLASLHEAMAGRAWNSDKATALLDEHPDAYKDIHQVMLDQTELTEPVYQLRAIVNYKGT